MNDLGNIDFDPQLLIDSGQIFRVPTPDMVDPADDWSAIRCELSQFPELRDAIKAAPTLVILRQPFVECVVSFIVSANNNIKRFTKTLAQMHFDVDWLCARTEEDFRRMGCGYRAAYLVKAANQIRGTKYEVLNALDDGALYKELRKIAGVGDKVARCVMLYCFHRLNIVPVDTWIEKVYRTVIAGETKHSRTKMADELQKMWGRYAGVAQQYLFYYMQYLRKEL